MLSMLQGQVTIGASGAVSAATGNGIYGVTKLTTGIYAIRLADNYNAYVGSFSQLLSQVTGSNVTGGSFVTGVLYQITALGNTTWSSAGLSSGLTAAVGQCFVATGVGAGTGTAKAVSNTGLYQVEVAQNPQLMLQSSIPGQGGVIVIQTLANQAAAFTGDTHTSTTVDSLSSLAGLAVGQAISGTGIPLGATIATVGASSITLSAAATASAATVPMTAYPSFVPAHPPSGSIIMFDIFLRNSSNSY